MNSNLQFACYHLTFVVQEPGRLPAFKGSTWHGILGQRLKRLFCLYPHQECNTCTHRMSCGYVDLYEPHLQTQVETTPSSFPKGFVIHGLTDYRKQYRPGDHLTVGLVLIGRMNKYFSILMEDLRNPFKIGKDPFSIALTEVRQSSFVRFSEITVFRDGQLLQSPEPAVSYEQFVGLTSNLDVATVQLEFLTPTRMKMEGRLNKTPEFEHIFQALTRKINSFAVHYGNGQNMFSYDQYQDLMKSCNSIEVIDNSLHWVDWKRYSRRSQETMTLGGFLGKLTIRGPLKPLLPLLMIGEYFHVGKQASFGLGQYTCHFSNFSNP